MNAKRRVAEGLQNAVRHAGQQLMDRLPRRSLGLAPARKSLAQCNKPGAAASATYWRDRKRDPPWSSSWRRSAGWQRG